MMRKSEVNEFRKFLYNESIRLEYLFIDKWNHIFIRRRFDALDLLELLELVHQEEYLKHLESRMNVLLEYMKDYVDN